MTLQYLPQAIALACFIAALSLAWRVLMGRVFLISAPAAFLIYQAPNVLGVIVESASASPWRTDWPILVSLAFLLFVLGGIAANSALKFRPSVEVAAWRIRPLDMSASNSVQWAFVWIMVAVCLMVGLLFYRSVGYNTLAVQLQALIGGSGVNQAEFSGMRADVLKSGYRAAGYAVQFVSIILPTLIVYIWITGKATKNFNLRVVAGVLLLVDLYFVTVQGGRTYILAVFVLLILIVAHQTSPLPAEGRLGRTRTMAGGMLFVAVFGVVTALQGRTQQGASGVGWFRAALVNIWERVGGDYSRTQMYALGHLESEVPAMGGQWLSQLRIALPGPPPEGLAFDVRVYKIIYGSTGGNNPLDPWGSYYYNWGVVGLLLVPLVLGFMAQAITVKGLVRGRRDIATVVIMSALCYRFMFVIDPYSLLLAGPFTLWILNRLMRSLANKPESVRGVGSGRAKQDLYPRD